MNPAPDPNRSSSPDLAWAKQSLYVGVSQTETGTAPEKLTTPRRRVQPSDEGLHSQHGTPTSVKTTEADLAAITELLTAVTATALFSKPTHAACQGISQWMEAAQVYLFWRQHDQQPLDLVGQLDPSQPPTGDERMMLAAAAEEAAILGGVCDSQASQRRQRVGMMAIDQFVSAGQMKRCMTVCLRQAPSAIQQLASDSNSTGRVPSGVMVICYDRIMAEQQVSRIVNALDAASLHLFHALETVQRLQPPRWIRWLQQNGLNSRPLRSKLLLGGVVLAALVLLWPTTYHAPVRCELQPFQRRFVAAPVDAPLDRALVRPGESVKAGQVLAKISGRELKMELAGKKAELHRIRQEQKGELARHQIAESKLKQLAADRLQSEIDLIDYRLSQLEIRSPIDGIVVSGDWKRSEGTPLKRGETLFEVAPLDRFNLQIKINEADLRQVHKGMSVSLRLESMPQQIIESSIERIHPKAELHQSQNVFLADALLVNESQLLRSGMQGSGSVACEKHALGWNLFHKAYYKLLWWLGW